MSSGPKDCGTSWRIRSRFAMLPPLCRPRRLKPARKSVVPTGLELVLTAYPALKRWAKLFRAYGARVAWLDADPPGAARFTRTKETDESSAARALTYGLSDTPCLTAQASTSAAKRRL